MQQLEFEQRKACRAAGHWVPPAEGEVLTREEKAFAERRRRGGDVTAAELQRSIKLFFDECSSNAVYRELAPAAQHFMNDPLAAQAVLEFGRRLFDADNFKPSAWVFQLLWAIGHCRCLSEISKVKHAEMVAAVEAAIEAVEKLNALDMELISVPKNPIDIDVLYEWELNLALLSDAPNEGGGRGAFASYFSNWVTSQGMPPMNEHVAAITQVLFSDAEPLDQNYVSRLRRSHPDRFLYDSLDSAALYLSENP